MHNTKMFDLENEGQIVKAHSTEQHPHLCHSMASINFYKRHYAGFHHFRDISISHFDLEHLGRVRGVQHS